MCSFSARGLCSTEHSCCLFVCRHKNEQFERNRAVYELYLLRASQKSKNISFYIPHERERTSGSQEKQTFQIFSLLLNSSFNRAKKVYLTLSSLARKTIITRVGDRNSG